MMETAIYLASRPGNLTGRDHRLIAMWHPDKGTRRRHALQAEMAAARCNFRPGLFTLTSALSPRTKERLTKARKK